MVGGRRRKMREPFAPMLKARAFGRRCGCLHAGILTAAR
jgi:hypothetical protein